MTDTMTEPQEQAPDDELDRRARYGGTDLFRGVLVLIIAAAVGILLVGQTPSSPRFLIDGDEETADADASGDLEAPTADASEDLDGESVDFSADEDTGLGAGSAMVDDEAASDTASADILPDATEDEADSDTPAASVNPVGTEDTDTDADAGIDGETDSDSSTDGADPDAMNDSTGRSPSEVATIVLNHTTRKGIASTETDKLGAAGYVTLPASNAATSSGSGVFYAEGYETEAEALATTLGVTTSGLVRPLSDPTAPTVASDVDLSKANIVVVLGKDGFLPAD